MKRILVLTHNDLPSVYAMNLLLPSLSSFELSMIRTNSATSQEASTTSDLLNFEDRCLSLLRANEDCLFRDFYSLSHQHNCPMTTIPLSAREKVDNVFQTFKPDLVLSIRFGIILKEPLISLPEKGILNLHSGILPDYRGVMATFWSMLNGEAEVGSTLHRISDGTIDTGDIVSINKTRVNYQRSYLWNVLSLYRKGVVAMLEAVSHLQEQRPMGNYVQGDSGNYFTFPQEKDLLEFEAKGLKIFEENDFNDFFNS